jgi:hypothetical protein
MAARAIRIITGTPTLHRANENLNSSLEIIGEMRANAIREQCTG